MQADIAADGATARRPRPWELAAVLVLVGVHAALAVASLWNKGVTFDEVTHLPAGLAAVATGELRLNPQHPPLVKLLAGAAAATASPRLPLDGAEYRDGREWQFGYRTLFGSGNDGQELLRRGRLAIVALSALAGVVLWAWSRVWWGAGGGLLTLALYAFSPTVLAQARLVTMDLAVAAASAAAIAAWWRATRGPERRRRVWGIVAGVCLGLALGAKFSALLLPPVMAVCELVANGPRASWRRRLAAWLVVAGAALVVVALLYLPRGGPAGYLADVARVGADHDPRHRFYLHGALAARHPHYFLVALGVKSALPGLLAILAGLVLAVTKRGRGRDDLYAWLPALGWVAAMSLLAPNSGVRYVLPAELPLLVLAGRLVPWAVGAAGRTGAALAVVLALGQAATAAAAHPDYLSWFNQVAGGPARGPYWLDDSNVDWGEDLARLPAFLAAQGVGGRVRVLDFGMGLAPDYGVRVEPMPLRDWRIGPRPGDYVVSAHVLARGLASADEAGLPTDWLRRYRPAAVLGDSLYLYRFAAPPDPAAGRAGSASARPP